MSSDLSSKRTGSNGENIHRLSKLPQTIKQWSNQEKLKSITKKVISKLESIDRQ